MHIFEAAGTLSNPQFPVSRVLRTGWLLLVLLAFCRPAFAADNGSSYATQLGRIQALLDARSAEGTLSGVVLVAVGGSAIYKKAFGWSDAELGAPMKTSDVFRIASVTKLITAAAALRLIDRRAMTLDTSVCGFVVHCPIPWKSVTLGELLDHSSGIPDLFESVAAAPVNETIPAIDKAISLAPATGLALTGVPGEQIAYSNFDYMLVGYAIERESRMPWIQAIETMVTRPLGMESTQYDDPWELVPKRVRGYTLGAQWDLRNAPYKDDSAYAAGGLLTTADDLLAFTNAVMAGPFMSDKLRALMLTPNSGGFGMGWQVARFWDQPVYDHSGGTDGFTSHLAYYPKVGVTIIVLSNIDSGRDAISTSCDVASLLFDKPYPILAGMKGTRELVPWALGSYAGGQSILRDGALWIYRGSDGEPHRLIVLSPTTAALADAQDVRLVWDTTARTMTGTSCGRPVLAAVHV
jgi:D-alanyl-D-alanine carboxypeptidase